MQRLENARNNEAWGKPTRLRLEEGMHPSSKGTSTLIRRIESGDPNAHAWNSAVSERISTYRPSFVAIDGLFHLPDKVINDEEGLAFFKKAIWGSLPARPSKLNGTDKIFVVAADNPIGSLRIDGNGLFIPVGFPEHALFGSIGMAVGDGLGGYTHSAAQWYRGYDHVTGEQPPESQKDREIISRRKFIGWVGGGIAGAALPSVSLPGVVTTRWPSLQHVYRKINSKIEPGLWRTMHTRKVAIDGRTALLAAKSADLGFLSPASEKQPVNSIVLGGAHTFTADKFLHSAKSREEAIRKYGASLDKVVGANDPFIVDFLGNGSSEEHRAQVIDLFAMTDIWQVEEPDDAMFKQDPQAEINRIVNLVAVRDSSEIRELLAVG